MPTAGQYNLDSGVDYTALFGGYASALTDGMQLAQPGPVQGFTLYQDTTPTVTGSYSGGPANWYEQNKRFSWIAPTTGIMYAYKASVGWVNVASNVPANTITTAMLQNNSVTLGKLAVTNDVADAGKGLLLDAGGANWLLADVITSRVDNSIPVAKITASGTNLQFVRTVGGITTWADLTSAQLNTILIPATGALNTNALDVSTWNPLAVMRVNSAGTFVEFVDPQDLLQDNSIPISRLSPSTGQANKYARVNSSGTGWEFSTGPVTTTTITKSVSTALTLPAAGATISFTHGLGAAPTQYSCDFVCATANNGYSVGDKISYIAISIGSGTELAGYGLSTDTTLSVTLTQQDNTLSAARTFLAKSTGLAVNFVQAQWTALITTTLIS
jgi:hypothetical protein